MPIDKNQVKKVSKLSRIALDESKLETLSKDIGSIISFVEQLNEIDTNKTEPLTSIINKTLKPRNDVVDDGKIKDEILKNSPDKNDDFFIVPKVVE